MRSTRVTRERLVSFADSYGKWCWGSIDIGVLPKIDDCVMIAPNPITQEGSERAGEFATVRSLLPALPIQPPAIFCVGLNYKKHAIECGMPEPEYPIIFMRNPRSALNAGDGAPIVVPRCAQEPLEIDYEVELGVIIGEECRDVPREEALSHVLGYVVANDVTARLWQVKRGGGQFTRAKSFDTFCPIGPILGLAPGGARPPAFPERHGAGEEANPLAALAAASSIGKTSDGKPGTQGAGLSLRTTVNGELRQQGHTGDMIFDVASLVAFLSEGTTLEAGTLILTGTPEGVGMGMKPPVYLSPGDEVTVSIEGLGSLTNVVEFEK